MLFLLAFTGSASAPLAADEALQPVSAARKDEVEGSVDLANAVEPDECICCERTQAAMTRYCKTEMVRGHSIEYASQYRCIPRRTSLLAQYPYLPCLHLADACVLLAAVSAHGRPEDGQL